jgi:hypothetical protein
MIAAGQKVKGHRSGFKAYDQPSQGRPSPRPLKSYCRDCPAAKVKVKGADNLVIPFAP